MAHPLVSCRAKIARAKEDVQLLDGRVKEFLDGNPYTVVKKDDVQARESLFVVTVWEDPPSLKWGIIVGQVLHNLRSALDHLAWQFAEMGTGGTDSTEFPIFRDKSRYLASGRGGGLHKIAAIQDGDVRAFIQSLQPFDSGENWPKWGALWLLHELSVIDKHRFTHLSGAIAPDAHLAFSASSPTGGEGVALKILERRAGGPFEDGAKLARVAWPDFDAPVQMYPDPAFYIAFPEGGPAAGEPLVGTLTQLTRIVSLVLDRSLPFFVKS